MSIQPYDNYGCVRIPSWLKAFLYKIFSETSHTTWIKWSLGKVRHNSGLPAFVLLTIKATRAQWLWIWGQVDFLNLTCVCRKAITYMTTLQICVMLFSLGKLFHICLTYYLIHSAASWPEVSWGNYLTTNFSKVCKTECEQETCCHRLEEVILFDHYVYYCLYFSVVKHCNNCFSTNVGK